MSVGETIEPEPRIFYLGDCDKTIRLFTYFYLLRSSEQTVLVDSGVAKPDGDIFNPGLNQPAELDPMRQLEARGVEPRDVDAIILTHLHWDHFAPHVEQFTNAELYVNARELDVTLSPPHPWFQRFIYLDLVRKMHSAGRWHVVEGDEEVMPGISVMHTGGHTAGSQAVIVQTGSGPVVLTGDVCFTYRNLEEDVPGGFNSSVMECFSGLEKIRRIGGIVLPSHDPLVLTRYPDGVT